MNHIIKLWVFLRKHLLAKKWFWIVLAMSLVATLLGFFKIPVFGQIGQVVLGLLIAPFVIALLWIVILTAMNSKLSMPRIPWGWVATVAAILLIALGIKGCNTIVERYAKEKIAVMKIAATNPPPARVVIPVDRPFTMKTLEIPAGGLPVHLYPGWQDYPLGGAITITTPSGKTLRDKPGDNDSYGMQPEGIYIFLADPPGSKRQVGIYNRW